MFDRPAHTAQLELIEVRILKLVKPRSLSEKQIAKILEVDPLVLSPIITELILKGYLQTFRRRRFHFFSKELCSITPEGISELDRHKTLFQNLFDAVRSKAALAFDSLLAESPAVRMVAMSAITLYKIAKAIV